MLIFMPGRVPQKLISALRDGNSEAQVLPVQWENKKLAQILNLRSSVCSDDGNVPVLGELPSASMRKGQERGGFGDAAHGSNKTRIKAKRLKKNDYPMEQGAGAAHPLHGAMSCSR